MVPDGSGLAGRRLLETLFPLLVLYGLAVGSVFASIVTRPSHVGIATLPLDCGVCSPSSRLLIRPVSRPTNRHGGTWRGCRFAGARSDLDLAASSGRTRLDGQRLVVTNRLAEALRGRRASKRSERGRREGARARGGAHGIPAHSGGRANPLFGSAQTTAGLRLVAPPRIFLPRRPDSRRLEAAEARLYRRMSSCPRRCRAPAASDVFCGTRRPPPSRPIRAPLCVCFMEEKREAITDRDETY
jgi:hypothetical protein